MGRQAHPPNLFIRAISGVDISGASSRPTQARGFVDFNLGAPRSSF